MPEESKKGHDKKKNDPKEQRRPRQRHQQAAAEKRVEKKAEEPKHTPKVTVPQKPVYESPPPEFFKNLKRETDEILKITEEENQKYKKKEIQSNWTKYEMPIDTYEEIEEHENMGADYEKLVLASHSIGGHFQFKHEKSWDINTGPSLYDKYFEINMDDLYLSLCTIPFHERNAINESIFNESDILSMTNRTARYKQKYFNDKSFSTPEIEAQDKILDSLRDKDKMDDEVSEKDKVIEIMNDVDNTEKHTLPTEVINFATNVNLEQHEIGNTSNVDKTTATHTEITNICANKEISLQETKSTLDNEDDETINKKAPEVIQNKNTEKSIISKDKTSNQDSISSKTKPVASAMVSEKPKVFNDNVLDVIGNVDFIFGNTKSELVEEQTTVSSKVAAPKTHLTPQPKGDYWSARLLLHLQSYFFLTLTSGLPYRLQTLAALIVGKRAVVSPEAADPPKEAKNSPVIESPEDLEKWLDDFLDG